MSSKSFEINGSTIKIGDFKHTFDFSIKQFIEIGSNLILLLKIPNGIKYSENIFGFSLSENRLVWQIAKVQDTENPPLPTYSLCPYVEIMLTSDHKVKAFNWCEFSLTIEPITGKILKKDYTQ